MSGRVQDAFVVVVDDVFCVVHAAGYEYSPH